jgi:hypothetical protein
MSDKKMTIKVKHIIQYLQTLDPEMTTVLDKDGWNEGVDNPKDEVDLISQRGLFNPYKGKSGDFLIIQN